MDDKDDVFNLIILGISGFIIGILLFMGVFQAVGKIFKPAPTINRVDSSKMLREQKYRMDQIKDQQRQLMDRQKQKVRDSRR